MDSKPIRVAGIQNDSITDGPGLRFALFVQGCPHHCPGCHNPETWDADGGKAYTPEEIFQMIQKNPLLSGVTLTGGEPMEQAEALLPFAKLVKEKGLHLAIYTGYTLEELWGKKEALALLSLVDVLVDGPYVAEKRSLALKFRGSSNQRILNVPKSLEAGQAILLENTSWTDF